MRPISVSTRTQYPSAILITPSVWTRCQGASPSSTAYEISKTLPSGGWYIICHHSFCGSGQNDNVCGQCTHGQLSKGPQVIVCLVHPVSTVKVRILSLHMEPSLYITKARSARSAACPASAGTSRCAPRVPAPPSCAGSRGTSGCARESPGTASAPPRAPPARAP